MAIRCMKYETFSTSVQSTRQAGMRLDRYCSNISPRWFATSSCWWCFARHPCLEELLDLLQAEPCRQHQVSKAHPGCQA